MKVTHSLFVLALAVSQVTPAQQEWLVDRYHPDFMYFDWWNGQPAFMPVLQQFAADYYYYDRSAERHQQPALTYKLEAMPANTATLDIERGKMDTLSIALADRYLHLHPLQGLCRARRVP